MHPRASVCPALLALPVPGIEEGNSGGGSREAVEVQQGRTLMSVWRDRRGAQGNARHSALLTCVLRADWIGLVSMTVTTVILGIKLFTFKPPDKNCLYYFGKA